MYFKAKQHVFSPIAHTHGIALAMPPESNQFDFDFWQAYDMKLMQFCTELHVLRIHGWKESKGVTFEIGYFHDLNKPIKFCDFTDDKKNLLIFEGNVKEATRI